MTKAETSGNQKTVDIGDFDMLPHSGDGKRHTFAEDHGMTPGQLEIIAKISGNSLTTFREREEAAQKYYKALEEAEKRKKEKVEEGEVVK